MTLSTLLILGYDVFPVMRERDGVATELFHCRGHLLGVRDGAVHHLTVLTGPPRTFNDALNDVESQLAAEALPGSEINPRLAEDLRPKRARILRPHRGSLPEKGLVVGHYVIYDPSEQVFRDSKPVGPQLVEFVSVLVEREDGRCTIPVRLRPPGSQILDRKKSPAGDTFYQWSALRVAFPVDTEVRVQPRNGFFLLAEELPEENPQKAREVTLQMLAEKYPRAGV